MRRTISPGWLLVVAVSTACSRSALRATDATLDAVHASQRSSRGVPLVDIECSSSPEPGPRWADPMRVRYLEIEPGGEVFRRLWGDYSTTLPNPVACDAATVARIQSLAIDALAIGPLAVETGSPDDTNCILHVHATSETTAEWRVTYPTRHAPLRPLLDALMPLLRGE